MKRRLIRILALVLVLVGMLSVVKSSDEIMAKLVNYSMFINGEQYIPENSPIVINDRTYLPVREIAEYLDMDVQWSEEEQKITITEPITIAEDGSNLFPFRDGDLYGYMDMNGKIRIEPQFYNADNFHEGLAVVSKYDFEKKIITDGVIDAYGNIAIPFGPFEISRFSEGFAVANDVAYVNSKELAEHGLSEHDWIIDAEDDPFGYYYIDRDGKNPFNKTFPTAYWFTDGFGLIDNNESYLFSEYSFIDKDGNIVNDEVFNKALGFCGGHAIISRNGGFEVVNTNFETLSSFNGYDTFCLCEDGYINVTKDDKEGLVDAKNNIVIPIEYEALGYSSPEMAGFSEGLCQAKKDGKWGYIDINNNVIIPFEYEKAYDFHNGLAIVKLTNGKNGIVNLKGELVFETDEDISMVSGNGMYSVGTANKPKEKYKTMTVSSDIGGLQNIRIYEKPKYTPENLTYLNKNLEVVVPH